MEPLIPTTAALYLHWPYCARICPYCDFNVHKARPDADLVPAMIRDMTHQRGLTGPRTLTSLHFGGGTPSLMQARQVAELVQAAARIWTLDPAAEIGLEANPALLSRDRVTGFRDAGVNRLSLGVQTFHDAGLERLGRDHDGAQAREAAALALSILPNSSLDLIFGWRGQTLSDWRSDLAAALDLGAPHISAYQLTIEPGTAFARAEARGQARGVSEALSADMYDLADDTLTAAGFGHYEVSNYARPGHRSRHNLAYWRGEDYIGIGPGAHGRITTGGGRLATLMPRHPKAYRERPVPECEALSPPDRAVEYLLMGLRTVEGIDPERYQILAGQPLATHGLDGLIEMDGTRLRATRSGRRVLDHVTERLLG